MRRREAAALVLLETPRLRLRRVSLEDAPFILDLLNEPSFLAFIGDKGVRDIAGAEQYIRQGPMASYERFGFGLYLVLLRDGDVPIGMCGILKRDALPDVDIGYAYRPAWWSQGYAFEAAEAVLAHGRADFGLRRIVAILSPENEASKRLLTRLGFREEGLIELPADPRPTTLFSINLGALPA